MLPDVAYPQGGAANWSSGYLPAHYQGTPLRAQGAPILDMAPPEGVAPERQAYPQLYDALIVLIEAMPHQEIWPALYARYELGLLAALGYVLMLPFLLIVPVFSAAGLRLAWLAYAGRESSVKYLVVATSVGAAIMNWIALVGFVGGVWKMFSL